MKKPVTLVFFLLFLSICNGQDFWKEVILPDSIKNVFSVNINSQNQVFLCTERGVLISQDNGFIWESLAGFISSTIEVSTIDEIYLGLDSQNRVLYSDSNGQDWDTIQTNFNLGGRIKLITDSILFAFDWGWISKSTNGGYNWDTVLSTNNSEIFNDIIENQGVILSGSTAFLDPQGGGINHSLNSGNSWQQISLSGYGVSSFALDQDSNLLCGVSFQYDYLAFGVFRSFDNGFTWNNILPGYIVTSLAVDINGGIYAGCDSDFGPEGVQFSSDNGMTWNALNSGLHEDASIVSLVISPNGYIYSVTVFPTKLYQSINPVVQIKEEFPIDKTLNIYPNPAHDILHIKLDKEINAFPVWHVRIVNVQGIMVYNEIRKPGVTEIVICSIQDLNSGFYTVILANDKEIYSTSFVKY